MKNWNEVNNELTSIYHIYDISLASKEKIMSNMYNLSNSDAKRYCDLAAIASSLIQNRTSTFDQYKTIDGTPMALEHRNTITVLHHNWWRYKWILIIVQAVLTLKGLTDEDKEMFTAVVQIVQERYDQCEACYVYTFVYAYHKGENVNHADDMVNNVREECEQTLIKDDAFMIKEFLLAITALHYDRECWCPVLKSCIDGYEMFMPRIDIVDKAINILREQKIRMCTANELSPYSSIGFISRRIANYERSKKCWCNPSDYLCISGNSKINFPVYIHKSDIITIIKLIREQFSFDLDGQYEKEVGLNLPHEPLSSLVVHISKGVENIKNIKGKLQCGEQFIEIDENNYYVTLPNVRVSYQDLEKKIFNRLINRSQNYADWFRQIINESGKHINSDNDFVLFAHVKVVSESARNLSTWMINLMCLDLIQDGITLNAHSYGTSDKSESYSPWNLFFSYHSMIGGSFKHKKSINAGNRNQDEIENKEAHIVMNWLCNSWLGNENVTMTNHIDVDCLQKLTRNELEDAERYGRLCIIHILHYRMYLTARWDNNHYEELPFLHFASTLDRKSRRILGQMLFDKEPLCINGNTVEEMELKQKQRDLSINNDRDEVIKRSIERFTELVKKTESVNSLHEFYHQKLQQLENPNSHSYSFFPFDVKKPYVETKMDYFR